MSRSSREVEEIKALLLARILELSRELMPDGRRSGSYWIGVSPLRSDNNPGSFWINIAGQMAGTYHDASTRETGDMIKLIQGVYQLDFKGALDWARGWLGLGDMPEHKRREIVRKAQDKQRDEAEALAQRLEKNRARAFGVFVASRKTTWEGSQADLYLQSRAIDLRALGRRPGSLGFLSDAKHHESGAIWPCMVAALTGPDNKIWAVHRTFLAHDGSGKAPVSPARKIWPAFTGSAVRLWRGDSRMSVDEAADCGLRETLVLTEGVEDGLSIAMARPDLRIWAAGSLANVAEIQLPDCIDEVIVCADNDWGKPQAEKLLNRGLVALANQGVKVRCARSPIGKDPNDALRGAA